MTDDERVRAAADAREQLLKYDRPMSKADEERAVEELSQTVLTLSAEVARLRAELTAAGEMGRELFQERNRALDALRHIARAGENITQGHRYYSHAELVELTHFARTVLAAHDQEPHDE